MPEGTDERCRYRMHGAEATDAGDCCCLRPVWREGRCVWHADVAGKSAGVLANAAAHEAGGRLDGAVLSGVTLDERVSLAGVQLHRADLSNARICGADLSDTVITAANLTSADLSGADLTAATLYDVTARNADFTDASLTDVDVELSDLTNVDLHDATLRGADLQDSRLQYADLTRASLRDADLVNVDCAEAVFEGADLSNALCVQCDFTSSVLPEADLTNALVEWSTFERAVLFAADLSDARIDVTTLEEADLSDADLSRTQLEKTTCDRANLAGADLRGADIYSSTLVSAHVTVETDFGDSCVYEDPDAFDRDLDLEPGERLRRAAWTYRAIERVAEYNALPDLARRHYIRRKQVRKRRHRLAGDHLDWLRAAAAGRLMGYGESPRRVAGAAGAVILLCALLYPIWGMMEGLQSSVISYANTPISGLPLLLARAIYFSTVTFTGLGYSSMDALGVGRAVATFETLAGGFLIALFVFVLGRRTTW